MADLASIQRRLTVLSGLQLRGREACCCCLIPLRPLPPCSCTCGVIDSEVGWLPFSCLGMQPVAQGGSWLIWAVGKSPTSIVYLSTYPVFLHIIANYSLLLFPLHARHHSHASCLKFPPIWVPPASALRLISYDIPCKAMRQVLGLQSTPRRPLPLAHRRPAGHPPRPHNLRQAYMASHRKRCRKLTA